MIDTVYMTLRPSLMETIRDHLKNQAMSNQQFNTLPDFIYDDVYADGQNPVPLNEIGVLVNQIQEEIEKFRPKYQVRKYQYLRCLRVKLHALLIKVTYKIYNFNFIFILV